MKVHFRHIRGDYKTRDTVLGILSILSPGSRFNIPKRRLSDDCTICIIENEGSIYLGVSFCSVKDPFSKAQGRFLATYRAMKDIYGDQHGDYTPEGWDELLTKRTNEFLTRQGITLPKPKKTATELTDHPYINGLIINARDQDLRVGANAYEELIQISKGDTKIPMNGHRLAMVNKAIRNCAELYPDMAPESAQT